MLKTQCFYDATGGGTMIVCPGSSNSLTVQEDCDLVGYAAFGVTDLDEIIMTVSGDPNWEASGLRLSNTWNSSATSGPGPVWLPHRIPMKANSVMAFVSVAGAAPVYALLYFDDRLDPKFEPPLPPGAGRAMYMTLASAASGTNTAASTCQMLYATTTLTTFGTGRKYKPVAVNRAAAATGPSLAVGISKGNDPHVTWWPINALVDGTQEFYPLPDKGLPEFTAGDRCNVHWLSDATEQPTANVTFAYAP